MQWPSPSVEAEVEMQALDVNFYFSCTDYQKKIFFLMFNALMVLQISKKYFFSHHLCLLIIFEALFTTEI